MPLVKSKTTPGAVKNDELSELQKKWKTVIESDMSDNQYLAWTYGTLEKTPNGAVQVHWHFKIASGKYADSSFQQVDSLETDNDLRVLAQRLKILGFEPQGMNLSELPKALNELQSSPAVVRISLNIGMLSKAELNWSENLPPCLQRSVERVIVNKSKEKELVSPEESADAPKSTDSKLVKNVKVWFVKGGKVHEGVVQSVVEDLVKVKVGTSTIEVAASRCEIIT